MQLAGRYMALNGIGDCAMMQFPCPDGYRYCDRGDVVGMATELLPFGKNTTSCEPIPGFKPPGGMVTTTIGEQKTLPWVLLGILALIMAWPALRPQYRRGIAA